MCGRQNSLFRAEQFFEQNEETIICFGNYTAISQMGILLDQMRPDTVMICAGGQSFRSSGAFTAIMEVLSYLPFNVPRFENIPPEPDTAVVEKIVELMKEEKPDVVIAIGGGSVMDAAKAAYLSWQTGLPVCDLFGANIASERFPGKQFKKVICVPTTSGTGSEVTPYSNIIDSASGLKCVIADRAILPEYAFVEPELTYHIPRKITVDTALDAMVHAIESLLNFRAAEKMPSAAEWAEHAVSMIKTSLPLLQEKQHEAGNSREQLAAAAVLGGMCIKECPTSLPHLCSYSFCGKTTHGAAVAALLPHFWRFYLSEPACRERTMLLSGVFEGSTPEEIVDSCEKFIRSCAIETAPGKLSGTDRTFIDRLASDAARNPVKLKSSPIPVTVENAGEIFHRILDPVWL